MTGKPQLKSDVTVFMCNRGRQSGKTSQMTTPVRVNADRGLFKLYTEKLKENHETTDVAFARFMSLYLAEKV